MGTAVVRGAHLRYEVLGTDGPWFVLMPGGRFGLEASRALGEQIAAAGSRVLLHDRPSCGASDVVISDGDWEDEATAGYLHELMQMLGATPAIAVGAGGGNRINFFLALRHPSALRGIVPCWPTGGRQAAEILAREYYGQFAEAAREGGMAAVCDTDYYRERIECNSRNRDLLLAMDVSAFIAAMERWQQVFLQSADWPTVAIPETMLRDIAVPALVLAGLTDDHIHGRAASEAVAAAIPGAEIRYFPDERRPANAGASWLREALQRRGAMPDLPEAILDFAGELSGVKSAHTGA